MIRAIIVLAILGIVAILLLVSCISQMKYMRTQKETGSDKKAMLTMMAQVMGDAYDSFTYVVGHYTKTTRHGRTTTYYYFPYILAFNQEDVVIFPFIRQEGKLYIRNRLPVDWSNTKLKYSINKTGVKLEFTIIGEKMPIYVEQTIKSGGVEKSDRPICVYQEQEVRRLEACLPRYAGYAKR